jgi:hypothetical protein
MTETQNNFEDGNDNILKTQIIPFTDFKDTEVIFWLKMNLIFPQNDKTTLKKQK